jgi:flagellar basal body-associated protein FliL
MAAPIPPAADPPSAAKLPPGAAPPPNSGQIFALLGADDEFKTEDFGDQSLDADSDLDDSALPPAEEMDEFDLPAGLGPGDSLVPDEGSTETPDEDLDFDVLLSAAREAGAAPADGHDLEGVSGTEDFSFNESETDTGPPASSADEAPDDFLNDKAGSESPPAEDAVEEEDSDPDDFALLGALALGGGTEQDEEPPASMMEKIEAELEDLPTKKVELDIEGIFLEDHDPPPVEEEELLPEPQVEAAPPEVDLSVPEEAPSPRKIPRLKLLMVLAPVLLLVFGLGFGVYKLFFFSPSAEEGPAPLVIDPTVPPREPLPGSLDLGAFYVNFPGDRGETIMEMTVVIYYKDLPDRAAIEARLPLIRDIIYLVAQGQGSQVISNGEAQRQLRQIAAEQANAALGGEHIDYVQVSQIRILQ